MQATTVPSVSFFILAPLAQTGQAPCVLSLVPETLHERPDTVNAREDHPLIPAQVGDGSIQFAPSLRGHDLDRRTFNRIRPECREKVGEFWSLLPCPGH